jgi:hypothetical protein
MHPGDHAAILAARPAAGAVRGHQPDKGGLRTEVSLGFSLGQGQKRKRVRPPGSVAETTVAERGSMR